MNLQPPTSIHCSLSTAVIQVLPDIQCGQIEIEGRRAQKVAAYVILPNSNNTTISCPINYFQEYASLSGQWIVNDEGNQLHLDFLGSVSHFLLTISTANVETVCKIPSSYERRLCEYFMLDIPHNEQLYTGFDCYAFVSFLVNAVYCPKSPPFDYSQTVPTVGDIIAISDGTALPNSIKHWALCIGDDKYLSKFGRTGMGAQSIVEVINLNEMKKLYSCTQCFVASAHTNAAQWNGIQC